MPSQRLRKHCVQLVDSLRAIEPLLAIFAGLAVTLLVKASVLARNVTLADSRITMVLGVLYVRLASSHLLVLSCAPIVNLPPTLPLKALGNASTVVLASTSCTIREPVANVTNLDSGARVVSAMSKLAGGRIGGVARLSSVCLPRIALEGGTIYVLPIAKELCVQAASLARLL